MKLLNSSCKGYFKSYDTPPQAIVLDIDGTDDETHGAQQLSLFNGYYDNKYCYMPLLIFEGQTGKLITSILCPVKRPILDSLLLSRSQSAWIQDKAWFYFTGFLPGERYVCNYGSKYGTFNLTICLWDEHTIFCNIQGVLCSFTPKTPGDQTKMNSIDNTKNSFFIQSIIYRLFRILIITYM